MALAIGKGGELNVVLRVKDDGSVTVEKFGRTAEQSFSKGANGAKAMARAYEYASGNLSALSRNIFSLKGAIAGLGVGAVAKQFIDAASSAEQYRVRLNVLLGSVSEGSRLFAEMSKYAARTPFEYQDIMGAATALSGVLKGGVDEIKQWMPLIGDLAAVSGLSIQETTGQVSRMLSAGAAAADMFRERGILAMLGFQAGVQTSAEETKQKLLAAWTDTNSRFRGATEQLAGTWEGTMSMLSDKWFLFRNQVMDAGLFDFIKAGARVIDADLGGAMEGNKEAAKRWADAIISYTQSMALGVARFVDVVDAPISRIARVTSDLWAEYQRLPAWAQEAGIFGALLGGKKGLLLVGAITSAGDEMRTTAEWWQSYSKGQIGFTDWLFTGNEDAAARLDYLKRQTQLKAGEIVRDTPNLPDALLGEGNGKKDAGSAAERVTTFFEQVRAEMDKARAAAAAAVANDKGFNIGTGAGSDPQWDKEQKTKLTKLKESLMSEQQLLAADYQDKQTLLAQALAADEMTRSEYNARRAELDAWYSAQKDMLYGQELSKLDESMLNERDLLDKNYAEKQLLLDMARENDLSSKEKYVDRSLKLDVWYSAEKQKLDVKDLKRTEAVENNLRAIRQVTFNHGLELLNALATNSKAAALIALALQKGLAIAETIVNTKVAQIRALAELGPIAGPPMAAAIGAWGAASVALIAATGLVQAAGIIGGGAPTAAPVYNADPGTSNPTTDPVASIGSSSSSSTPREITIVIDADRMLTSTWVRDQLIPEINSAVGDGVVLKVSG